jgi:hypothetical protein
MLRNHKNTFFAEGSTPNHEKIIKTQKIYASSKKEPKTRKRDFQARSKLIKKINRNEKQYQNNMFNVWIAKFGQQIWGTYGQFQKKVATL